MQKANSKALMLLAVTSLMLTGVEVFSETVFFLKGKIKSEIIKNNNLEHSLPGVTCRELNKDHWEIKITINKTGQCDLSALALLPDGKLYNIWLTIPGGSLNMLSNKNIKLLYVSKINETGNIDFTGLADNISDLSLVSMSEEDMKSLPDLPELVNFSVHFKQKSTFDFSFIDKNVKIESLSFTNVDRFVCEKQFHFPNIYSLSLLKSDTSILKYLPVKQLIVLGVTVNIKHLSEHQKNLETLICKNCTLTDVESFRQFKHLQKLIINDCKVNREFISKLPVKEIVILPSM